MARRKKTGAAFSLFAFQDIITSVTGIMILVTLILALELLTRVKGSPAQQTEEVIEEIQETVANVAQLEATVARNMERIENLKAQIAQGASDIGAVAGFDERAVQDDVSDMQQIDADLANDLEALADRIKQKEEQITEVDKTLANIDADELKKMLDDIAQKEEDLEALQNRVIFNPTPGETKTPWLVEVTAQGITVAKAGVSAPPTRLDSVRAFTAWAQQRNKNSDYFVLLVKPDGIESFHGLQAQIQRLGFDLGYDLLQADRSAIDPERGAAAQ